jgi:protein-L-isoaspartate(D-aspartate) O-methyltransferase
MLAKTGRLFKNGRASTMIQDDPFTSLRRHLVAEVTAEAAVFAAQTGGRPLDRRVLDALEQVPRHEFVPPEVQPLAYINAPLPIGHGKTISQPFIVALMTQLLDVQPGQRVLEVGTGFGYQAAILSCLTAHVHSVERILDLAQQANKRLTRLGYDKVEIRVGNGRLGWPDRAPFDRIMVTAAPDLIPPALLQQLKPGGKMVIPTGIPDRQVLLLVERDVGGRTSTREILPVRFSELEEDTGPAGTG